MRVYASNLLERLVREEVVQVNVTLHHLSIVHTIISQKWVDGFTPPAVLLENFGKDVNALPQSNLLVVITTDRGLCGGVNSSLARVLKNLVPKLDKAKKDVQVRKKGPPMPIKDFHLR